MRRKFSSMGGRAPGNRPVERMLAPDWAQKMLCITCPIGEQHLLSSFRRTEALQGAMNIRVYVYRTGTCSRIIS